MRTTAAHSNRSSFATLLRLAVACAASAITALASGGESFHVVVPDSGKRQLLVVQVTAEGTTVQTKVQPPLALPLRPTSITSHRNRTRLIVTTNQATDDGSPAADIGVHGDGELKLLGVTHLAHPTGYTSVDRSGRFLLTVNYKSGSVNTYRLNDEGRVGELACHLMSPKTFAHSILNTPDNRFCYVPCVKENNALYQYSFDETTGQLTPLQPHDAAPPAMFGPRHVAYHPSMSMVYFSNEQQLGVSVYSIDESGELSDVQHATSIPRRSPYENGKRGLHASDLVVTPDGQWLFLAVRDFVADEDSVFTFKIEVDGRLSQVARTAVGDIPWKLDLSPSGDYLLVGESQDRTLNVLRIESDGKLSPMARVDLGTGIRDMVVVK